MNYQEFTELCQWALGRTNSAPFHVRWLIQGGDRLVKQLCEAHTADFCERQGEVQAGDEVI